MSLKENLEFLKGLKNELKNQENDYQASPRFWVVMDYKNEPCWEGHAEKMLIYSPSNGEEYNIEKESIKELIADDDNMTDILEDLEWMSDSDVLTWFQENIDEQAHLVPQREVGYIVPDTMFITKEEAKAHIERNKHHYSSKAHTYAMTAWRSPQVEKLWSVLENLDIEKLINKL